MWDVFTFELLSWKAAAVILSLFWLSKCVHIVGQQTLIVVETLGKFAGILEPGLNLIVFPFQRPVGKLTLKIKEIKTRVEVKTADNMFVALPVNLMVQVSVDRASEAWYKLSNPEQQISSWILNAIRGIAAGMTLEDLFKDRDHLVGQVEKDLSAKLADFGYILSAVLVDQPTVSDDVQASFNRVVTAKREREAAEQEAEAMRIKTVRQAEAEADAQRARAKGLADSRKLLADGLRVSLAEFEKCSVSSSEALAVLLETNRIDAMRDVSKHGNLILMGMGGETSTAPLLGLTARNGLLRGAGTAGAAAKE
ncbi:MAG: membrane protease subunit, stomatin/prohibitin [Candidatus Accumulibacter sp. 66-26]|nr:MAG: membrane protease subunit, stomatin/prohibitin [Candidatus Accumulibacter sp. 66-26]